jgi:peptidylamidoglycolate lyase
MTKSAFKISVIALAISSTSCASERSVPTFARAEVWPSSETQQLLGQSTGIAVDSHNHVFVFHRADRKWVEPFPTVPIERDTILILDADTGQVLASWGDQMMIMPHGPSVDSDDNVWVTDVGGQQVHKFSHDGVLQMSLGTAGESGNDTDHFDLPADVEIDADGRIFIADGYENTRIVSYSPEGEYLGQWGRPGNGPGEFNLPHGISLGADGAIFVADRGNSRLQIFDTAHNYMSAWSGERVGRPYGVAVGPDGNVYVIDGGDQPDDTESIVRIFSSSGQLMTELDTRVPTDPSDGVLGHDIAVGSDGSLYIIDVWANRIVKYSRTN